MGRDKHQVLIYNELNQPKEELFRIFELWNGERGKSNLLLMQIVIMNLLH